MLRYVIEGKMEGRIQVIWRQGRISQWLLDDFKETRGYWKLNAEALYLSHSVWTSLWKRLWTCRKQTTGWTNEWTLTVPNATLADISRNIEQAYLKANSTTDHIFLHVSSSW